MKFIDIGANLSNNQFNEDINSVIINAINSNIEKIYLTTVNKESLMKNFQIIEQFKNYNIQLFTTYGLHPHNANHLNDFILNTKNQFENKNIKLIGEIGLDFFRLLSSKEEQINCFEFFLELSKKTKLPIFLHERNAHKEFVGIFKSKNIDNKSVIHCFTGNKKEAQKYLDLNMFIGITGWLCDERRNTDLIEAIKYIPIDKILIETDSPFLKPRNSKQKSIRNEPKNLIYILDYIANIKNINIELASSIIYNNTINFLD